MLVFPNLHEGFTYFLSAFVQKKDRYSYQFTYGALFSSKIFFKLYFLLRQQQWYLVRNVSKSGGRYFTRIL